jgi:hypothetical protein
MPISLLQLTKAVVKLTKATLPGSKDAKLKITQINITNMIGVNVKHVTALVDSATEPGKRYKIWIMFTGVPVIKGKDRLEKPSLSKTKVFTRCSCPMYYFYLAYSNKIHKCLAGRAMKPYVRKTKTYPPKNPNNIPSVCKHLIFASRELSEEGLLKG